MAGITVGNGGGGEEFFGQTLAERIGASGLGIGHNPLEGVVELKPLKNEIPKCDDGSEKPFIKSLIFKARQLPKFAARQQGKEEAQELAGRENRLARGCRTLWGYGNPSGFWGGQGVFFDFALYVSNVIYIP